MWVQDFGNFEWQGVWRVLHNLELTGYKLTETICNIEDIFNRTVYMIFEIITDWDKK